MAEEILVKECLSDTQIREGNELVGKLDAIGFQVDAAYWVFMWETNRWRLHIVTPEEERSFHSAFATVSRVSQGYSINSKHLVKMKGPKDRFYQAMLSDIRRDGKLSDVEFDRLPVGNELVDLYIYRLPAPPKKGSNNA
jgi:hypothetical protein